MVARAAARLWLFVLAGCVAAGSGGVAVAADPALVPSFADSFRIGTSGPVCEAQAVAAGAARRSIFDRRWALLCREVSRPIGSAWFSRDGTLPVPGQGLDEPVDCVAAGVARVAGIENALVRNCRGRTSGLEYRSYSRVGERGAFVVAGLAAYDSALQLALRSLVADRVVPGEIVAASLGAGGGSGFYAAKAQAADAANLIGQGYRRNAAGDYAEAAQIFSAVATSIGAGEADSPARRHELTINHALQVSNLGQFDQSAVIFARARTMSGLDPVQARLGRNFEAIDALNRGDLAAVPRILARPVPAATAGIVAGDGTVEIDAATAEGLSTGTAADLAAILGQRVRLTAAERVEILDAQAESLRGTALRLSGNLPEARSALLTANRRALAVRDGRVISVTRLRSQILTEIAETFEAQGDLAEAERLLREVEALVAAQYPDSASVNAARARLAGFMARHGRKDEAHGAFRALVAGAIGNRDALVGMSHLIQPYFAMLTDDGATAPGDLADLLLASQLVERPGAAATLSQLARELAGGNDAAAALFRRALAVSRDIERNRIQLARTANSGLDRAALVPLLASLTDERQRLDQAQLQLASQLSAFPQYRAVARGYVTLDELRATLQPGEGYFKLVTLGERTYAVLVTPTGGRGWRVARSSSELAALVTTLRESISVTINGVRSTYPFDIDNNLTLSEALLGPARADLTGITHLVFEPDGAMLQLPANLLVLDTTGVEAYRSRVAAGGDEFDMRGIAWLGRKTAISTALSAASFRDARTAPPSKAARVYLGLGQNQPLGAVTTLPGVRGASMAGGTAADAGCDWPVATWNQPIAATELKEAAGLFGKGRSDLMTGAGFTDTAIEGRTDLADFRVVHFATHGLVTAPRPGCPARPALLTSFGGTDSDGLLRFDEIFNLHLDADLVILSACDTAGGASLEATREAGVTSGGGQALDGLVRAFIAAGGRQVIASHWPAPDDYNATERLIGGFFGSETGGSAGSVAAALQRSQLALMDDPLTSHPFYWAGFAIVGDGERPLHVR
ncbi:MAG: CHAT domain-containing protein [Sphingomonadales bacterium]|nr:CHAT domain-containing protein [Sphingomonadales bacterium]MBU3993509.1 CHAT domain-containing protein [Alphaproteobacteria bacterium]